MKSYKYPDLMYPVLQAIKMLGGSASRSEILEKVIQLENIPPEVQDKAHAGGMTNLAYNAQWARAYLGKLGMVENSAQGVCTITSKGETVSREELYKLHKKIREDIVALRKHNRATQANTDVDDPTELDWKAELLAAICSLTPAEFEKLTMRILRESGFIEAEVTGRSGDGGIDGIGILKVNLLSFHVYYQCKKYDTSKTIGSSAIRDFRGALQGRSDKGLFITTTSFSQAAKDEATRDGAPPIDLIDGEELCLLMKRLEFGVRTELVEKVTVKREWFQAFKASGKNAEETASQ